jgi:hypothetical protein
MNEVRSLVRASCSASGPRPALYSDHMLAELLCLHREMVDQLRLELLGSASNIDFLTSLIQQHEKAAELLHMKLQNFDPAIPVADEMTALRFAAAS